MAGKSAVALCYHRTQGKARNGTGGVGKVSTLPAGSFWGRRAVVAFICNASDSYGGAKLTRLTYRSSAYLVVSQQNVGFDTGQIILEVSSRFSLVINALVCSSVAAMLVRSMLTLLAHDLHCIVPFIEDPLTVQHLSTTL